METCCWKIVIPKGKAIVFDFSENQSKFGFVNFQGKSKAFVMKETLFELTSITI